MILGFDGSRAFVLKKSGTENYSYQLLKALAKIDKKNGYIIYLRPGTKIKEKFPDNFVFKIINYPRLWTQIGLAKATFKDQIDVLFIPAHTSPLVHKKGLKTVVTVHDLGSEYLPKMHQLKQRVYLKWITNFQLKSATKLIAVSKATKDDLVKKVGVEAEKIEIVYEGYDKNSFKPARFDTVSTRGRSSFGRSNSLGKYFLFVGTVQPRKNLARVIEAFAKFLTTDYGLQSAVVGSRKSEDLKLVIAGSRGWLSDDIYKLPEKLGIEDKVKFLGYVPDKDLPALYSGAIAFVYPSLFEGFGLPILEAQASGCPVITSNISSMPEIVGKGAILVDPYKIEDITNAMIKVISKAERVKLIKRGFENVKRFSWEKCTRETLKVLENL